MQNVLEALFGELTVLGFIALFAYFLLELGVFAALSVEIYGEPTHLVHLFEQVHFQLFFVMAFFIGEALVLVRATLAAEDAWMSLEKKLANVKIGSADEMATSKRAIVYGALVAARRLHGSAAARRLGPLHRWRHAECGDELVYVLLRERFIRPPHKAHAAAARRMTVEHHEYGGAAAKKAAAEAGSEDLPPDFDFSNYLRRRCFEIVASTLHVSTTTWLTVIAFVALSLETPAVLDVPTSSWVSAAASRWDGSSASAGACGRCRGRCYALSPTSSATSPLAIPSSTTSRTQRAAACRRSSRATSTMSGTRRAPRRCWVSGRASRRTRG